MAFTKKMDRDSGFVFVSTGDGELDEGQIWEAALFAPHHKLDNLIVIVDWNGQQIDGQMMRYLTWETWKVNGGLSDGEWLLLMATTWNLSCEHLKKEKRIGGQRYLPSY
jgi:pyruvate dehydrogenase complex dehydrogenase (E1) component